MLVRTGPMSNLSPYTAAQQPHEAAAPSGVLDPQNLRRLVRRHIGLIAAAFALAMLLGAAAAVLLPPRYTATAVLLVDPRQQRVVQSEAVLPGIGNDSAAVESQIEVIQSTTLARRVIAELHLEADPEFAPSGLGLLVDRLRAMLPSPPGRKDPTERAVARFEDQLRVVRRGQTYVLEVAFTARDPDLAARIANAVAADYLEGQVAQKRDATQEAAGWLDGRLDELRRQADAADRAVADYKAAHNIVDTPDSAGQRQTLVEQQLADINAQLVQARVKESDVQSRYDQIRRASPDAVGESGLPEALQSPVILALRTQYAATARSVAEMGQVYGARHPAIQAGAAQLAELRRQIGAELARIGSGLRNELDSARARARALEASLRTLKAVSAGADQDTVKLRELQREAEATRTVLAQFLLRYKETSEQQGVQVPDARVLSPASPPLRPSAPNVAVILGLAAVAGLGLGLGAALAADRLSRSVRSAREVEDLLALPVLAQLPAVSAPAVEVGRPRRPGDAQGALGLFALTHPLSRFGEAIRGLAIRLRSARDGGCAVMVVTSALPGEGSSTVAGNVAHVTARSGSATLLIDADLRRPADAAAAPGLYEALRDDMSPLSLLRRDPDSGLLFLPAGRVDDAGRASELLTSRAMERALAALRPKFDAIVVDAPPMLASVDARALLDVADAGLLVVAWADTRRDVLEVAVDAAGVNADKFRGIVLNKVGPGLPDARELPRAAEAA